MLLSQVHVPRLSKGRETRTRKISTLADDNRDLRFPICDLGNDYPVESTMPDYSIKITVDNQSAAKSLRRVDFCACKGNYTECGECRPP